MSRPMYIYQNQSFFIQLNIIQLHYQLYFSIISYISIKQLVI